jgi:hypothetical protein
MSNGLITFFMFCLSIIMMLNGKSIESAMYLCTGWLIYAMGNFND